MQVTTFQLEKKKKMFGAEVFFLSFQSHLVIIHLWSLCTIEIFTCLVIIQVLRTVAPERSRMSRGERVGYIHLGTYTPYIDIWCLRSVCSPLVLVSPTPLSLHPCHCFSQRDDFMRLDRHEAYVACGGAWKRYLHGRPVAGFPGLFVSRGSLQFSLANG